MASPLGEKQSLARYVPPFWGLVKIFLPLAILSYTSARLNLGSGSFGGVTILWPSNAYLVGALLCSPKRYWPVYLSVGYCIDFYISYVLFPELSVCGYLAACNSFEVLLAALPLYQFIAPKPDLTERRQLIAFLAFGVVLAPAIACYVAPLYVSGHWEWTSRIDYYRWFTADALGMATVMPLYLAFNQKDRFSGRSWREIAGLFMMLFCVILVVFWQSRFPLLFVMLPPLLLLGVRLGLAGSALGLLLISVLGGYLSTAGHGPLALMHSTSLSRRDVVFQSLIAISMLMLYIVEVVLTESKRLQANLYGSERRFRLLAEASSDIIVLTDLNGKRDYVSPAAKEVLGWSVEESLGGSYRDVAHPDDVAVLEALFLDCLNGEPSRPVEYRCRKADGKYLWLEINTRLHHNAESGKPIGFVNVTRDISRRKLEEEHLHRAFEEAEHHATFDALTGIANRRHFDLVLAKEWLRAMREQSSIAVLLLDVDRFKPYNDVYGHRTGDECLRQVVAAMKPVLSRPADLLARYGGEEFVVVLPDTDVSGAARMAERIRFAVEQRRLPHPGNPPHGVTTISVGYSAIVPLSSMTATDLVEAADRALYQAKSSGRNRTQFGGFTPEADSPLLTG